MTTKRQKKSNRSEPPLTTNLFVDFFSITCKNRELYEQIYAKYVPADARDYSTGTGIFKYEGKIWNNDSIFFGFCTSLNSGMFKFVGKEGLVQFENFRKDYLNSQDVSIFSNFNCTCQTYCAIPLNQQVDKNQMLANFETIKEIQKKKQPKMVLKDEQFCIGSKNTGNFLNFSMLFAYESMVSRLKLFAKLSKDQSFFELLSVNAQVSLTNIVAYSLYQTLSKFVLIGFLIEVRDCVSQNHNFAQVIEPKTSKIPLTQAGKTVSRSLTTLRNKLLHEDHSSEAKTVFLQWLQSFYKLHAKSDLLKDLFANILRIFTNKSENVENVSESLVPSSSAIAPAERKSAFEMAREEELQGDESSGGASGRRRTRASDQK